VEEIERKLADHGWIERPELETNIEEGEAIPCVYLHNKYPLLLEIQTQSHPDRGCVRGTIIVLGYIVGDNLWYYTSFWDQKNGQTKKETIQRIKGMASEKDVIEDYETFYKT